MACGSSTPTCARQADPRRCGHAPFDLRENVSRVPVSPNTEFHGIVARSVAMRTALAVIERAAASDATVLLEGETGTGKELAARALPPRHRRARTSRSSSSTAARSRANLLESELFGHERGAFTGAGRSRARAPSRRPTGGTIFLDEIGELPLELQPKLLRVLESARGPPRRRDPAPSTVDVRVIAATNRDLRAEVNARNDSARTCTTGSPSVAVIAAAAARRAATTCRCSPKRFLADGAATTASRRCHAGPLRRSLPGAARWPGNVRELRNYLERSLVFMEPQPLDEAAPRAPADAQGGNRAGIEIDPSLPYAEARKRALEEFERAYVKALIDRHGGRVSAAAAAAETGRVYLYKLARRHGIKPGAGD